jgi:hypothetical protein
VSTCRRKVLIRRSEESTCRREVLIRRSEESTRRSEESTHSSEVSTVIGSIMTIQYKHHKSRHGWPVPKDLRSGSRAITPGKD